MFCYISSLRGLPAEHPFWSDPYTEWTNLKAWSEIDVGTDKALRDKSK